MKNSVLIFVILFLITCCDTAAQKKSEQVKRNDWEIIGPGGGGATFIPAFSYHNNKKFLIRCDMTGSYLTEDGGQSFRQINFPNGASSFAFDPKDSSVIYIGSASLNKSKDGGKTWDTIFPKRNEIISEVYSGDHAEYHILTSKSSLYEKGGATVNNIRVDPVLNKTLYFSMGNFFFYTNDDGKKWNKYNCNSAIQFIYTNNANLKDSVFIFTASSLFVFDKKSRTISGREMPVKMIPAFSITGGIKENDKKTVFYALHNTITETGTEFGTSEVWMSDNGSSWTPLIDSFINNNKNGIKPSYSMIACSEFNAEQAYVVTNRYEEKKDTAAIYWYGAVKTNDAGKTWNWVWKGGGGSGQYAVKDGKGVTNLNDAWAEKAFGGEYIRLMDAGVDPYNGNIAVITDWYRTMKTMDAGKKWKQVYSNPQTDGSFCSNGMNVTTCYGVHFDPFDSNHIAISYTDIGYHHSYNRGKSWIRSTEGVPAEWANTCYWVAFDPAIKNKLWSAWSGMHDFPRGKMTRNPAWKKTARGGICVSEDGGKTWQPTIKGMGFDSPAACVLIDPKSRPGNRTLYATVYNKGVFKSTDDGQSWSLMNNGIGDNNCAFELTLTGSGDLFLVIVPTPMHKNGEKGRAFYSGAVYKSIDGANTWKKLDVSKGLLFPDGMECDPVNPQRLYLACWADIDLSDLIGGDIARTTGGNKKLETAGGIFLSEDGGNTWKPVFDKKQYVYDVTADPYHPGRIYANTFNRAAYRSDDYGKTWKKIEGYDFHWGHRVIIDRNDHEKVYLTTYGSSVWHGIPVTE